jgi:heme o synthase
MSTIKTYYSLTKPGVLYGNAITAAAGYLLASRGMIEWWLFLALCVGSTLVIASACVLNNYLDQDIDKVMARTKKRAIVSGEVSGHNAVIFSIILGLLGIAILIAYTNPLVVAIGVIGFVDYVVLYGMLSKRLSVHGTLVGSISGAMPILAGYCAATGAVDVGAFIVFAVLFLWQMPEFYSIAIYRRKEYQKAGVPVISVMNGVENTKHQIIAYTVMFVVASLLLAILGYAGSVYLIVMAALGGYWIGLALQGIKAKQADEWARRMFHFSLVILLAFCGLISVDAWLP